jgi:hypothetical protein
MTRDGVNRMAGGASIVFALLALAVVTTALVTGFERNLKDEGVSAHLWQLFVAAQLPLILLFLVTADWSRWRSASVWLAVLVVAFTLDLAPVAYFHL